MSGAGHMALNEEKENTCRVLVGKPEGKRPFGTPTHRYTANIEMQLKNEKGKGMRGLDDWGGFCCEH